MQPTLAHLVNFWLVSMVRWEHNANREGNYIVINSQTLFVRKIASMAETDGHNAM